MAKKADSPTKVERIKAKVHSHDKYLFVIPDQDAMIVSPDVYILTLNKETAFSRPRPADVNSVNYEYCPYCGEKLIETYEVKKGND